MDLLRTRQVDLVHQSSQTRMYGFFTHGTVPHSRLYSSGFLSLPDHLRRLAFPDSIPSRVARSIRREYLDHILFWTTADLENKLLDFRTYFNNHRTHDSLEGRTPDASVSRRLANLRSIRWQPHCRALYQTPAAA